MPWQKNKKYAKTKKIKPRPEGSPPHEDKAGIWGDEPPRRPHPPCGGTEWWRLKVAGHRPGQWVCGGCHGFPGPADLIESKNSSASIGPT